MRTSLFHVATLCGAIAMTVAVAGCVVDDPAGSRGQSNAPAASVPDSGNPVRRESAQETLRDAERQAPANPDGGVLSVEPGDRGR
jgi:hypothetical protein